VILPTKHLSPAQSLIGVSALLLMHLVDAPMTVNQLWEVTRREAAVGTFDRFVLALDVLFLVGALDLAHGELRVAS
jgi:hypothetical protein